MSGVLRRARVRWQSRAAPNPYGPVGSQSATGGWHIRLSGTESVPIVARRGAYVVGPGVGLP